MQSCRKNWKVEEMDTPPQIQKNVDGDHGDGAGDGSPIVGGSFCVRIPPSKYRDAGLSPLAYSTGPGPASRSKQHRHEPIFRGAYTEETFVLEAVGIFWELIVELQKDAGYSPVLIGLSGGNTPRNIFRAFGLASSCGRSRVPGKLGGSGGPSSLSIPSVTSVASLSSLGDEERATASIDWERVIIFLVDERYVPSTDENSNQRMIRETLLKSPSIALPPDNFIAPDTSLALDECVQDYQVRLLRALRRCGRLHMVTLGLGDDGHIASWFPPLTLEDYDRAMNGPFVSHTEQERGLPVKDRITVSLRFLACADTKLFFLTGESKIKKWKELAELDYHNREIVRSQPLLVALKHPRVVVCSCPPIEENADVCAVRRDSRNGHLGIVIFGASGDLACKKTVPAIFSLFCEGFLPDKFSIVGYARSKLSDEDFWGRLLTHLEQLEQFYAVRSKRKLQQELISHLGLLEAFKRHVFYVSGGYGEEAGFRRLNDKLSELEGGCTGACPRLFYLALPPSVFSTAARLAKDFCWAEAQQVDGPSPAWRRVVVEKPFGRDSESAAVLSKQLLEVLSEDETYRIDHYLGKEMVLSIFSLRFANATIAPLFSAQHVSAVRITFKEDIGIGDRGGYFDQYGIIRDIMQNHLLQVLTLIAMERPASLTGDDIRDEKTKVLKQMLPLDPGECVIGQFGDSAPDARDGYLRSVGVPPDSTCPTFCTCVCRIDNDRWQGVPFILKAGKGLEERLTEVRIQFKPVPTLLYGHQVPQNELVIRVQPTEAIYLKMMTKQPGLSRGMVQSELDLTLHDRFNLDRLPDAYERLLLDVLRGDQHNFVRTDELRESWRVFTPLLKELENSKRKPFLYPFKSRGPPESDEFIRRAGYIRYEGYEYSRHA